MSWLQIVSDVVTADIRGEALSESGLGPYRLNAILFSLCAVVTLAIGLRTGTRTSHWLVHTIGRTGFDNDYRGTVLYRAVLGYLASLVLKEGLVALSRIIPALAQPVLALILLKYVFVYLIAAQVFEAKRGYYWLLLIALLEIVTGLIGYYSGYKEAFFVMLIALATSRRPASVREFSFGIIAVLVVVWISLVWTASKNEYRNYIIDFPAEYRVEWFARRLLLVDRINTSEAATDLFARIGYTDLFSQILEREEVGSLPSDFNFYVSAVKNVLTPRVIFPDKASLDDSKKTTALLGTFIDADTSIGVGYVAQAEVDFGFPGMLFPIFFIGLMMGGAARYFMTRVAPLVIREALTTATLFLSFQYAANIDKNLGGFLIGWLVMGLALKFGYPFIADWLEVSRSDPNRGLTQSAK